MKKNALFFVLSLTMMGAMAQQAYVSDKLELLWESPAELMVPEAVLYDAEQQVIYVSNINGSPAEKDGNGFISKLSPDGKILELKWATGLDAPKGLGIAGGFLFVSDITRVVKIDIKTGKQVDATEISGTKFLNDIITDPSGAVYVSDSRDQAIYVIRNGKASLLVQNNAISGVNGLFFADGKLLAGTSDRVVSIHPNNGEIKDYILNTGGIDGLVPDGKGNYLISDWVGHVHLINPSKEKVKLLDVTPAKMNAADIDYAISKNMLLVPTFADNRVLAYKLK